MTALIEYSKEIVPLFMRLNTANEILKEWKADNAGVQERLTVIKELQDELKEYVEETEAALTKEISDIKLDIKLAVSAAAKGTAYKKPELAAYFSARAREKVSDVVSKGELFQELEKELA